MTRILVELVAALYTVFWVAYFGREALRCYGLLYPRGVRVRFPALVVRVTRSPTHQLTHSQAR